MKKIVSTLAVVALVQAVLISCLSTGMVKKDRIVETGRIAIVSVVMPRIADTTVDHNRTALQACVQRALGRVHADLKSVRNWTVVDPAEYKGFTSVLSLSKVPNEEIAARFPSPEERRRAKEVIASELSQWKRSFIGAKALPVVPRSGLVPNQRDNSALAIIPSALRKRAGKLCHVLNVDAVAFVDVVASITHQNADKFHVKDNRTDGAIHMAQTIVIVDKRGEIIVDMGSPSLGKSSKIRDLLPLYIGSGEDAIEEDNIDLADPQSKIQKAIFSLIDETASDMVKNLKKAAAL
jgi:competence protein ComGC